jgi:alcohol dehydrogenase class IV
MKKKYDNSTKYYNPVKVIKSKNWLEDLYENINLLQIKSPLIISTKGNNKRLNLSKIFSKNLLYTDVNQNPNFHDCKNIINFCKNKEFDAVIAIGSGSVMDISKVVISNVCLGLDDIKDILEFKGDFPRDINSIFIPTNHGTGSEVTMWGTIWDTKEGIKYSISNKSLYPKIAILCPELALTLPLRESIITTLDALSHSFESIWNKNSNSKSTEYAIKSICMILEYVNDLKSNPKNLIIREKLLSASNLAGLAFSNTKTAAAHSISYPLTGKYGMPHGVASSISLVPLLKINERGIKIPLDKILKNLKFDFSDLTNSINSIPENIIPFSLKKWNIFDSDFSYIVKKSFTKGRMDNNIVDLSQEDVLNILRDIQ